MHKKNILCTPVQVRCILRRGTPTKYPHISNNKPHGKEAIQSHLEVIDKCINPVKTAQVFDYKSAAGYRSWLTM